MTNPKEGYHAPFDGAIREVQPGRLVSLLDMVRFYADKFYGLTQILVTLRERLETGELKTAPPARACRYWNEKLDAIDAHLTQLDLVFSRKSIPKVRAWFSDTKKYNSARCRDAVEELDERIKDELEQTFLVCLPRNVQEYYDPKEPLFGISVDASFPSSCFDISEAGKCYAVGRETACVMHLMRALESPLQLLAADLEIRSTRDNWGNLLNEIEEKIKALPRQEGERKTIYSDAATQFRFFKNAWRDHAMHARGQYAADDVTSIFSAVKALMKRLSKRLSDDEI